MTTRNRPFGRWRPRRRRIRQYCAKDGLTLRLIFMGSPEFGLPTLRLLLQAHHEVALVVSQPARPSGRSRRLVDPPIARFAAEEGLPLHQPERLRQASSLAPLHAVNPDVIVVAAFGQLLPRRVLELAPHGCLNVHPSLLPRWRGASPIQAALLAGDSETGVTIIRLEEQMDAGPMLVQARTAIGERENALELEQRLAALGARLLVDVLEPWVSGKVQAVEQDDAAATYCRRLERTDAELDWSLPAAELDRVVRGFRGRGEAFTHWTGRVLKILRATPSSESAHGQPGSVSPSEASARARRPRVATGAGYLILEEVALEGRSPTSGDAFLHGYPDLLGAQLGQPSSQS